MMDRIRRNTAAISIYVFDVSATVSIGKMAGTEVLIVGKLVLKGGEK
jgi:hypothetical protein